MKINDENGRFLLSFVIPLHNEEACIDALHHAITTTYTNIQSKCQLEIVFINDGSKDNTLEKVCSTFGNTGKDISWTLLDLSRNFGKEAALTAGLNEVKGDAVVPLDADLQDPIELIPEMIDLWESGYDVVLAKRIDRRTDSLMKRWTSIAYYKLHNKLSKPGIPENVGDFRLISSDVVKAINSFDETQRFMKGLLSWVGFRVCEIEFSRPPRSFGKSKFTGAKLFELASQGITSFTIVPLRLASVLGLTTFIMTVAYSTFLIARKVLLDIDVPGYTSIMVAILLLGGFQLAAIGLLGEYVGRTYLETKRRPVYLVRQKFGTHYGA